MALVAFGSVRSPGLTTSVLALAASWPEDRPAILAELDPDGGTIAARRAANPDPGLKTLAACGRHYLSPPMVLDNTQRLSNGTPVLLAPPSPDRTVAALAALTPVGLGEVLRSLPGFDVLADCGRIDSRSPALATMGDADVAIFVIRPTVGDIVGLRDRLETLEVSSARLRAGIVTVGDGPISASEIAETVRLPVISTLEWDSRSADSICEGRRLPPSSKLFRSAQRLAADLAGQLPVLPQPDSLGASPTPSILGSDADGQPSPQWAGAGTATLGGRRATSWEPIRP